MEAERKAGYPIKTHPQEQQYQAWIDLTVCGRGRLPRRCCRPISVNTSRRSIPIRPNVVFTFNYDGKPTLAGLRGYCAVEAIGFLDARQHREPSLLAWMFGPVTAGGPAA